MTSAATRDRKGKFTRAEPEQDAPVTPWIDEDAAESLIWRARVAYSPLPPYYDREAVAADDKIPATQKADLDAELDAQYERELAAVYSGRKLPGSFTPPPVLSGCGDEPRPAQPRPPGDAASAVLLAVPIPSLGELDPASEAKVAAFEAAHEEQAGHGWRLVSREDRPDTTPGFRSPVAEGWDGEPAPLDTPGPVVPDPPAGPGAASEDEEQD